MAKHTVTKYYRFSKWRSSRIIFYLLIIFLYSETFSQNFFPIESYDCYTYNYYSYEYYGGIRDTDNYPYSFTCIPAVFNGKEYISYFNPYYSYDSLTNILKVYINNSEKLAVDFNRLGDSDTLYYEDAGGLLFSCTMLNEYFLGQNRRMYQFTYSITVSNPPAFYSKVLSYKLAEGIGEIEKTLIEVTIPFPGYGYVDSLWNYRNIISLQRGDSVYNLFSSPKLNAAVLTPGVVNFSWQSTHPWLDAYQLLRKEPEDTTFSLIVQLSPQSTSYSDSVEPGRKYLYSLRTLRDIYYSFPDTIVINTVPQPVSLTAQNQGDLNVHLQWNYSYVCDSFVIERCKKLDNFVFEPYTVLTSISDTTRSYNDLAVTAGEYYKYRILAFKDGLISPPSNEVDILPLFTFLPPEGFSAQMNDYECVDLNWSDPNEYSSIAFEISRREPGEPSFQILAFTADTAFTDETVGENQTYIYKVRGKLGWKYTSSKTDTISVPSFNPILPPGDVAASVNQMLKVELSWQDNSTNEKYFIIGRGKTAGEIAPLDTVERNTITFIDLNPKLTGNDKELFYGVKGVNPHAGSEWSITEIITGVSEIQKIYTFNLAQNYPNPFNPTSTISYSIPAQGKVRLIVYDALGTEVRKLVDEEKDAGNYNIEFNADGLASGIYFYRLSAGERVISRKMILLK